MGTIKRGVSLYSYQNETFQGKVNLEDCIRTSAELARRGSRSSASRLTTKDAKDLTLAA